MKTIGLIGGMSPESTVPYYRTINDEVRRRLGGLHSAKILLCSVDFQEIESLQQSGKWDEAGALLSGTARALESAGADFLVLCTNTMHKVAPAIEEAVRIPLLHIADPTAAAIRRAGLSRIGLLGTRFTMEEEFYRERLRGRHGLEVLIPEETERETVHRVIFDELCHGVTDDASRSKYRKVIEGLVARGAEGVILGCTEISLLIGPGDSPVPLFDTTEIHARAAVETALNRSAPSPRG